MQRIGVDFTSASRERAGIGRYARELIRALSKVDLTNRYVLFVPRDAEPPGERGEGRGARSAGGVRASSRRV